MRKVIFIGGTSYSGSTFLDMMIANDPKGFSCGEVYALFNPYKFHHFNPQCNCGDKNCSIWQEVLIKGENNLYETIFNLFPNIEFIVDSSKSPFWILSQINRLKEKEIKVLNLLIWKSPLEIAYSFKKKNNFRHWQKSWINYHRLYFTLIKDWRSIKYLDLTRKFSTLKRICDYVDIEYFKNKERYWEKKHHNLFGNISAKIHLYPKDNKQFKEYRNIILKQYRFDNKEVNKKHKKIYYENINDERLISTVNIAKKRNNYFNKIERILEARDLSKKNDKNINKDIFEVKYSKILLWLKYLRFSSLRLRKILNKKSE
ncbi:MAG: hypothetical protein ACTSVV_10665 [Promethearchaeota archaeon]